MDTGMDITHDVFNQPDALCGYNLFDSNAALRDALRFHAPALTTDGLSQLGECLGTPAMQAHARLANANTPQLHTHDRMGHRIDEVEFHGATAWLVGEEGRGVPQILAMGALTRLDCALGSSGLMRQALALALDHARQRQAFGKPLIAQPLMRNVPADTDFDALLDRAMPR
jgi:hypothetical protein